MEIHLHSVEPGLICLRCRGTICQPVDDRGDDPLETVVGAHGWTGTILLDLLQTETIDSEGIAWLMRCHRRSKAAGGVLALCSVPPRVTTVLRLCQVHRILPIWDDEAAARAALANGRGRPEVNATPPRK